jgi:hypothetical protein
MVDKPQRRGSAVIDSGGEGIFRSQAVLHGDRSHPRVTPEHFEKSVPGVVAADGEAAPVDMQIDAARVLGREDA